MKVTRTTICWVSKVPQTMNRLQEAEAFLRSRLQEGPTPVAQLVEEAAGERIARRTLFGAATSLNALRFPGTEHSRRIVSWDLPEAVAQRKRALARRSLRVMEAAIEMRGLLRRGLSWQFALSRMRKRWHSDDEFEAAAMTEATRKWP